MCVCTVYGAGAISKLPVGHQRLRTIYRDVTREPFRLLHPLPGPLPAGKLFQFVPVSHLLAPREFAWAINPTSDLFHIRISAGKTARVWMCVLI